MVEVPLLDIGVIEILYRSLLYRESPTGCLYNNVLPVSSGVLHLSNLALRGVRGNFSVAAGGYNTADECILVDAEGVFSVSELVVSLKSGAVVSETVSDVAVFSDMPVEGVTDTSAVQDEPLVVSPLSVQAQEALKAIIAAQVAGGAGGRLACL